jgi:hypothetical protein
MLHAARGEGKEADVIGVGPVCDRRTSQDLPNLPRGSELVTYQVSSLEGSRRIIDTSTDALVTIYAAMDARGTNIQSQQPSATLRSPMKPAFLLILIAILVAAPHISGQGNDVVRYPFLVHGDLPGYPALAKTARITGTVQMRVIVDNGEVVGTETISGHPLLVTTTIDNIKSWKFDKTVRTTFATTFIYRLDGESERTREPSNPTLELELPSLAKITAKPPYTQILY